MVQLKEKSKKFRRGRSKHSFFSICFFLHEHSRLTGQLGREEVISLTSPYHINPLHRHLDINWAITAESSPL